MNPPPTLSGAHLRAYEKIFQHPLSHNLTWREVSGLFAHIGQAVEEPNGRLTVTRGGQSLLLHRSTGKDLSDPDDIVKLRHFLERTEPAEPGKGGPQSDVVVVINHQEARLYRTETRGAAAEQILPPDPVTFFRHAHNSKDFTRGQEKPDPNTFFAPIAQALSAAGRIMVFGDGKGMSSEMEQFIAWLKARHPELAQRIITSRAVDLQHLSVGEILAQARSISAGA